MAGNIKDASDTVHEIFSNLCEMQDSMDSITVNTGTKEILEFTYNLLNNSSDIVLNNGKLTAILFLLDEYEKDLKNKAEILTNKSMIEFENKKYPILEKIEYFKDNIVLTFPIYLYEILEYLRIASNVPESWNPNEIQRDEYMQLELENITFTANSEEFKTFTNKSLELLKKLPSSETISSLTSGNIEIENDIFDNRMYFSYDLHSYHHSFDDIDNYSELSDGHISRCVFYNHGVSVLIMANKEDYIFADIV